MITSYEVVPDRQGDPGESRFYYISLRMT
ncbi:MAG: hypothetical protein ACLRYY_04430 [Anaerobutyricum soehngenii]